MWSEAEQASTEYGISKAPKPNIAEQSFTDATQDYRLLMRHPNLKRLAVIRGSRGIDPRNREFTREKAGEEWKTAQFVWH